MGRCHSYTRLALASLLLAIGLLGAWPARPARAANEQWCPPATNVCTSNAFLDFWRAQPYALETLGYPIDQPRRAPNGLVVQFFERAVLEWHPENGIEYQVLLTRLGAALVDGHPRTQQPPVPCSADCALLPQTNHTLRGVFLAHWSNYGGLPVYGFPMTEEYQERNVADDKMYTVQYFERNRFEYHPEHAGTRYEVLLGRLGAELLAAAGSEIRAWPVVAIPNYGDRTPPSVSVGVTPPSGLPGTKYVVRATNLPPGAIVVGEWWNEAGTLLGAKAFTLAGAQTTLDVEIDSLGTTPGTHTVTLRIGSAIVGRVSFAIVNPERDQQLVVQAAQLIMAIPDARYLVDNQLQNKVAWLFLELPEGAGGYYEGEQNLIVYGAFLRVLDPHDLAAVMGHEGQHAYDIWHGGPPRDANECYVFEYRGFLVGAALWKTWYGPNGKRNPVHGFEQFMNDVLYLLQNDRAKFESWLVQAYAEQCGKVQAFAQPEGWANGGIPQSLEGLPAFVPVELPQAGEMLRDFDPFRVDTYTEDPAMPLPFKQ